MAALVVLAVAAVAWSDVRAGVGGAVGSVLAGVVVAATTSSREEECYTVTRWDWRAEPDAPRSWREAERRLVVCEPGLFAAWRAGTAPGLPSSTSCVVPGSAEDLRSFAAPAQWPAWAIPALHARTRADLDGRRCGACGGRGERYGPTGDERAFDDGQTCETCRGSGTLGGVRALLAVRAERRAIVCSPREALDLRVDLESTAPMGLLAYPGCRGTWDAVIKRLHACGAAGFQLRIIDPKPDTLPAAVVKALTAAGAAWTAIG